MASVSFSTTALKMLSFRLMQLINEIASVQNNTVVVLTNGSAVTMPWISEVPVVLETWLGGQAGAGGIADVLFGKVNPSGKLAETFPVKLLYLLDPHFQSLNLT